MSLPTLAYPSLVDLASTLCLTGSHLLASVSLLSPPYIDQSSDCLNTKDTPSQSSRSGFALRFTGPVLLAFVEEKRRWREMCLRCLALPAKPH